MSLGTAATEEDAELISKLFGAIGKIWKADEKLFDAITGLRYMILTDAKGIDTPVLVLHVKYCFV